MSSSASRMTLGGAVVGSFLGMFSGGVLGGLYGWLFANLSYGLDGALFGGCAGVICGGLYGGWQAFLEHRGVGLQKGNQGVPRNHGTTESGAVVHSLSSKSDSAARV